MFAFKSPLALLPMIFSPLSLVLVQPVNKAIAECSTSNIDSASMTVFYISPNPSTCNTTFPSLSLKVGVVSIIDGLDAWNMELYAQRDIWGMFIPKDFYGNQEHHALKAFSKHPWHCLPEFLGKQWPRILFDISLGKIIPSQTSNVHFRFHQR